MCRGGNPIFHYLYECTVYVGLGLEQCAGDVGDDAAVGLGLERDGEGAVFFATRGGNDAVRHVVLDKNAEFAALGGCKEFQYQGCCYVVRNICDKFKVGREVGYLHRVAKVQFDVFDAGELFLQGVLQAGVDFIGDDLFYQGCQNAREGACARADFDYSVGGLQVEAADDAAQKFLVIDEILAEAFFVCELHKASIPQPQQE